MKLQLHKYEKYYNFGHGWVIIINREELKQNNQVLELYDILTDLDTNKQYKIVGIEFVTADRSTLALLLNEIF